MHGRHPVAYLDGPGGTQVPQAVVDAMSDYLLHHNANTAWAYPTSEETDAAIAEARGAAADFVNGAPEEIAFGNNMTTLTFHVSRALGRGWGPNDTVVVTELDHHGNIGPWRALEKERGIRIISVKLDPATGELDDADLTRALAANPALVAIGAASNALGTMPDVARIAAAARKAGALVYIDAVHYAPHVLPDVQALGGDFLVCSPYKFYGPHAGFVWVKRAVLESLDVPKIDPAPNNAPDRLETGTLSHEAIVGTHAVIDFLASFGRGATRRERLRASYATMHARGAALFARLWDGLGAIKGVTRYGPPPTRPRTPTISISVNRVAPAEVARRLAAEGLFVSHGDFYAATVAERLGRRDGFVRIGVVGYTSESEIDRTITAVGRVAGG